MTNFNKYNYHHEQNQQKEENSTISPLFLKDSFFSNFRAHTTYHVMMQA